jgi:glutamine amidotransferase
MSLDTASRAAVAVVLADYGAGNLSSVIKSLEAVGAEVRLSDGRDGFDPRLPLVVPGVGHFAATAGLGPEWHVAVRQAVSSGTPILGICLGMQWLFEGSGEAPGVPGAGVFPGTCFEITGNVKVPHVGWNELDRTDRPSRLLDGLEPGAAAYFTHSFAAPVGPFTAATATHGVTFSAVVEQGSIFGVQFHPEKSGRTGLRMLANFLAFVRERR